ncbi:MAG: MBL fold metallo-hydrolase [Candidatus Helarchaeota archaeon]
MKIRWLGTAALEIKTGSSIILMDPWLSRFKNAYPIKPEINKDMIQKADYIFITHGHFDHFADTPYLVKKLGIKVYVSTPAAEVAIENKGLDENLVVKVNSGDSFEMDDFTVKAIKGKHITFDFGTIIRKIFRWSTYKLLVSGKDLISWKKGEVLGWIFNLLKEDNKKVTIFGSLGFSKDLFKEEDYSTDVLIIPVAGRRDAWKNAIKYIEIFSPKLVIPTHFDDSFPPLSDYYMYQIDKIEKILKEKHPDTKLQVLELNKEMEITL